MKKQTILTTAYIAILVTTVSYLSIAHGLSLFNRFTGDAVMTAEPTTTATDDQPAIQVALLLDTSGSMSGLIEQAKSQLWKILNELAMMQTDGQDPTLEIGLYEYGNANRKDRVVQIRKIVDFTTDMDLVSEKLFALNTSGGDEYCGMVINSALNELEWRSGDGHLKVIYIAGNEPFTQGPVPYQTACTLAGQKGVVVNTIFCGAQQLGIQTQWLAGAQAGKGAYMFIDHNKTTTYIETPYDEIIIKLNRRLNTTYIPYGKQGQQKVQQQRTQDSNAASYSSANLADRAKFKSSKKYKAESWDLVDAYEKDKNILNEAEDLPADYQGISVAEMEAQIQKVAAERAAVQEELQTINAKRDVFIAEAANTESSEGSLESSILRSIRTVAKEKGYEVKK